MEDKGRKATIREAELAQLAHSLPTHLEELRLLLDVLKRFGVINVYEHLANDEITPRSCIAKASRSLDLMAFHGDKWLFEAWFEAELERLRLRKGNVRFLISSTISSHTKKRGQELIEKFPRVFSMRVFDDSAIFRVVIIDDNHLLLGHYGYDVIENDGLNAKGWKSPQLFIEDNCNWSLLIPFREFFRMNWERGTDIAFVKAENEAIVKTREFRRLGD